MKGYSSLIVLLMNLIFLTKQSSGNPIKNNSKIEPELLQQLQNGGRATMIVELTGSQKNVIDFLSSEPVASRGITFQFLSSINFIIVRNGDLQVAQDLAKFPEVLRISPDGVATIASG